MLGIRNKTVKARRILKKLDKKAYEQGALGVTGNAYVQSRDRLKDSGTMTPPLMFEAPGSK